LYKFSILGCPYFGVYYSVLLKDLKTHLAHSSQGRFTGCLQVLNQQLNAAGNHSEKMTDIGMTGKKSKIY
jgi:hypothetical protein